MSFDVVITGYEGKPPHTLATVLEDLLGLDPAEARKRAQRFPATVIAGTSETHARSAAGQLRDAGAVVQIVRQARKTAPKVSVREAASLPVGQAPTVITTVAQVGEGALGDAIAKAVVARSTASSTPGEREQRIEARLRARDHGAEVSTPPAVAPEAARVVPRRELPTAVIPPEAASPQAAPEAASHVARHELPTAVIRPEPASPSAPPVHAPELPVAREPPPPSPWLGEERGADPFASPRVAVESDPFRPSGSGQIGSPFGPRTADPMANDLDLDGDPFTNLGSAPEDEPAFNAPWRSSNRDKPLTRALAASRAEREAREREDNRRKIARAAKMKAFLVPVALLAMLAALASIMLYRHTKAQLADRERALSSANPPAPTKPGPAQHPTDPNAPTQAVSTHNDGSLPSAEGSSTADSGAGNGDSSSIVLHVVAPDAS